MKDQPRAEIISIALSESRKAFAYGHATAEAGDQRDRDWTPTSATLPPEKEIVETMSAAGLVQDLKRCGRLWFIADGSMYIYYEVAYWRRKTGRRVSANKRAQAT